MSTSVVLRDFKCQKVRKGLSPCKNKDLLDTLLKFKPSATCALHEYEQRIAD